MKKLKYGIMGTGRIVERFVGAVRSSEAGEVYAIASRSLENAEKKARELGISRCYGSYEQLVSDDNIDVIYIPTINSAHRENAVLALTHNKHVLIEKPMTLSREDTKMLFDMAREKGLFIMEAQKSLFLPITEEIKKIIYDGVIGEIHLLDYMISIPEVGFKWFYDRKAGGGALFGSGNYILAHAMHLLEEELISSSGHATLSDEGTDLQCIFNLKSEKGILVDGKITTMVAAESGVTIYGEKGRIFIGDFWKARHAEVFVYGEESRQVSFPVEYEMVYEVDHVNRCIDDRLMESPVMTSKVSLSSAEHIDNLWNHFLKRV
ncbi:Gfo/Idh/MocA family oxidoreductase [Proteiniclasticum sp.]|uniref:Gfo/Idh/MocA family protein n=1 Tax=Proteiniclasticum sp. TaxID=2053595 RepID=UPI0028A0BC3E|nr:Gfo/Idh/MocA family oxidoreductase [Proteiniclasticum sp.]